MPLSIEIDDAASGVAATMIMNADEMYDDKDRHIGGSIYIAMDGRESLARVAIVHIFRQVLLLHLVSLTHLNYLLLSLSLYQNKGTS